MVEKTFQKQKSIAALTVLAVLAWVGVSFAGFSTAEANNSSADCPNGPLHAELTGAATGGRAPGGMAMFRERGSNALMVMVRGVEVNDNTALTVMIGDTNVGTITVGNNGNGQLRLDSAAGISEGTTITVMNGTTTVLAGTFACVAGGGNTNTNTNTNPTITPTVSPTTSPTTSPTEEPTVSPTMTPTESPTPTMTPTV